MDIEEISAKFNQTMKDVNDGLSKFNDVASTTAASLASTTLPAVAGATATPPVVATTTFEESQEIRALEIRLEELKKRLSANATSSSALPSNR